jgi:heme a synthase
MPRRLLGFAWGLLAFTLFVVAFGAWVRITGSGAGCGQHWPTCHGEIVPRSPTVATIIEFTHRATSGAYGLLVIALLVWTIVRFPRGHLARAGAWLTLLFTITEALVGAGLVKRGLVADDASVERAVMMAIHLVNTSLLTGALVLTIHGASRPAGARLAWRPHPRTAWLVTACLVGVLFVSMSGAVTALGDTLFPVAAEGTVVDHLGTDQAGGAHFLQRLRALHPVLAIGVGTLLVLVAQRLAARRVGWNAVALMVLVQVTAGVINVMLSAPGWMQLVHLVLASLLWIALVLATLRTLEVGRA